MHIKNHLNMIYAVSWSRAFTTTSELVPQRKRRILHSLNRANAACVAGSNHLRTLINLIMRIHFGLIPRLTISYRFPITYRARRVNNGKWDGNQFRMSVTTRKIYNHIKCSVTAPFDKIDFLYLSSLLPLGASLENQQIQFRHDGASSNAATTTNSSISTNSKGYTTL